jgi:hypothetical protein
MADFFPTREAELLKWLKNFSTVVTANAAEWDIPVSAARNLATLVNAYTAVYEKANSEHRTKILVREKNEKAKELKAYVRTIKNKHIDYNDKIRDTGRQRLALPIRNQAPSPRQRPESRPLLEVVPSNHRQHTVMSINQATGKKTKPTDADKVRYAWEIRDSAPVSASDLRHSITIRKTTRIFEFNETDRGKSVYYAACYENGKGDLGSWSNIVEAIIP